MSNNSAQPIPEEIRAILLEALGSHLARALGAFRRSPRWMAIKKAVASAETVAAFLSLDLTEKDAWKTWQARDVYWGSMIGGESPAEFVEFDEEQENALTTLADFIAKVKDKMALAEAEGARAEIDAKIRALKNKK